MPGFAGLGVPAPILAALEAMGYQEPTPVQAQAIPPLLAGRDGLVEAQTGSGKTTAFGVPAVTVGSRGAGLRVIVLVPTRELARQVADEIRELGAGSPFRAVAVTGGVMAEKEERTIGGDVRCVVATPGRLLALLEARKLKLDHVELVVLDEADRMLDMGFQPDVERVLEATTHRKQTALVSATLPQEIMRLASRHLREPAEIHATPRALPTSLTHQRLNVFPGKKDDALVALLKREKPQRAIVFVRTRDRAATTSKLLKKFGFAADPLQGEMSHDQRRHVFDLFSRGITQILVATDIASRGLDVPEMELVINYDLPGEPGAYTHRAGRAARLGREGRVVSFVLPDEKTIRLQLERESGGEWAPYRLDQAEIDAALTLPKPEPAPRTPRAKKAAAPKTAKGAPKPASAKGAARPARAARPGAPATKPREKREPRIPRVRDTTPRDELPPSRRERRGQQ